MKVLQLQQYGQIKDSLVFNEVESPVVQMTEEDLIICVKAAGINPIDLGIINGSFKNSINLNLPVTLAYDFSGTVMVTGKPNAHFKVGDHVFARVPQYQMGTLSEFIKIDAKHVCLKPNNLSFEEAASIPLAALTAMQALKGAKVDQNTSILVFAGSCGLGSSAIQYAKSKGARVYAITKRVNSTWIKELGADRMMPYGSDEYKHLLGQVDIVFDTVSGRDSSHLLKKMKPDAKVISIYGNRAKNKMQEDKEDIPKSISIAQNKKNTSFQYLPMTSCGKELMEIKSLVEKGIIKPSLDQLYPFRDAIKAFIHLASGTTKGKIVIKMNN